MSTKAWQRRTTRAIGWVVGAFWLVLFFGLVDLSTPLLLRDRPEFYDGYLIETGWGVLFTFFAGLPMLLLGARPAWVSAALMSAAAGVAVLIASLASGQPLQLVIAAALLATAAAVWFLDPTPKRPPSAGLRGRMPLLGLAVIAVPFAVVYAVEMIRIAIAGDPAPEFTYDFDHYPIQASAALVIPIATALMALRLPGWRAMTFLIAAGTAWFAVASIVFPDHLGSWGALWGWAAVAWAVALALLAVPFGRHSERVASVL